ncbi:MAG: hypothetical protein ACYC61_00155 [Isosphaeraceae bacterium]
MQLPRMTTRRWMIAMAVLAAALGAVSLARQAARARRYRRMADAAERMELYCRKLDAMDPKERARKAVEEMDDPYLDNPAWNHRMVGYWEEVKIRYSYAADHPWLAEPPRPPDP